MSRKIKNQERENVNPGIRRFPGATPTPRATVSPMPRKRRWASDPNNPDTDGGDTNDGTEVASGTDPFNPLDDQDSEKNVAWVER